MPQQVKVVLRHLVIHNVIFLIFSGCLLASSWQNQDIEDTTNLQFLKEKLKSNRYTDPSQAIRYGEQYLKTAELNGIDSTNSDYLDALNYLGISYYNVGNYDKTLDFFLQVLQIQQNLNDQAGISRILNNLGIVFDEYGRINEALEYYRKSLKIKYELGDSASLASTLSNIGFAYNQVEQPDSAYHYFIKAYQLDLLSNDLEGQLKSLHNIGLYHLNQEDYDSAMYYFAASRNLFDPTDSIGSKYEMAFLLKNMAAAYQGKNQLTTAQEAYEQALQIGITLKNKPVIRDCYEGLSSIFKQREQYSQAYEYFNLYTLVKDSLFNEDNNKIITQLETNFEIQKREKEIELLKKEKEISSLQLSKNKVVTNLLMVGILLVVVLAVVLYKKYQFKIQANELLESQNREIAEKNINISDSFIYAKGIQEALLSDKKLLLSVFDEAFVYCKARDIVNGDFYWFSKKGHNFIVAAVDCTGHGVPGAFMTVMGNSLLNEIVNENDIIEPSVILEELDKKVSTNSQDDFFNNVSNVGMDMAVCTINRKSLTVKFAGAKRPLYYFHDHKLQIVKGDKYSIGANFQMNSKYYTQHELTLCKNDLMYLFTDGIADQFGEKTNQKYMMSRFRKFLIDISGLTLTEQYDAVKKEINKWKGDNEQTDDMLLIGIKMS
ncbi:MAG: tetratricopeptide repeat protein [Bacteroidetes bacterium]|nr:tetratricopeptide repeat protein [Bacteroidota bacterium]